MFTLHNGDCTKYQPPEFDVIMSDVPYPDIDKGFEITSINFLGELKCRQFIFWSAVEPFPFDYTAIHIWHKPNGNSSQHYERIFERNGQHVCKVFRVAAILPNYTQFAAECVDHPTQKPLKLMRQLVAMCKPSDVIYDPFMGSGTTGVACVEHGRSFVGCELSPKYFAIAESRIKSAALQQSFLTPSNTACTRPPSARGGRRKNSLQASLLAEVSSAKHGGG